MCINEHAPHRSALLVRALEFLVSFSLLQAPAQTPVFSSITNLQSIAVQVVDKKGNFVPCLSQNDFTLLEDGRPQKVAFFGTHEQPVSLAILLDSSRSMDFGRKYDRAHAFTTTNCQAGWQEWLSSAGARRCFTI